MTIVLMTGTIRPNAGTPLLSRTNVEDRIKDYLTAFDYYLGLLSRGEISALVFVENSNFGMERFAQHCAGHSKASRIELISYDGKQSPGESRFVGETKLLRDAFRMSEIINSGKESHVWKVTGRYIIRNLVRIIRTDERDNDLILNCRDYPMRYVDFGLVGFSTRNGRSIVDRIVDLTTSASSDEREVRNMIDGKEFADLKIRKRFSYVPDFIGVRGSDSSSYGGLRYRLLYLGRSLARRIVPWVWV